MWRWGGKKGHPRVGQAMWMLEKEGGTWEMTLKKQFFGNFKLLSGLLLDTFVAPTLKGHPHQPTFVPLSIWTSDENTYQQNRTLDHMITGKEYFLEFLCFFCFFACKSCTQLHIHNKLNSCPPPTYLVKAFESRVSVNYRNQLQFFSRRGLSEPGVPAVVKLWIGGDLDLDQRCKMGSGDISKYFMC